MDDEILLKKIDGELDSLSFRMLELMKEYIDVKITLEDFIKSGSLHLAKSRYIMGNRNVSVLQLPTEDSRLDALVKTVSSENIDGLTLSLNRMKVNDLEEETEIKQRKQKTETTENVTNNTDKENKSDKTETSGDKNVMQDPIKWFGVLIPQNLRHAQTAFSKAIDYSVQCVNLQLEILHVREQHQELTVQRKNLLKNTKM